MSLIIETISTSKDSAADTLSLVSIRISHLPTNSIEFEETYYTDRTYLSYYGTQPVTQFYQWVTEPSIVIPQEHVVDCLVRRVMQNYKCYISVSTDPAGINYHIAGQITRDNSDPISIVYNY